MNSTKRWIAAFLTAGSLATSALAEWPQYRGPGGTGISTEKMLTTWPAGGPKVLWTKNIGGGLGSFAMKDGKAFFLAESGNNESAYGVDAKTGADLWTREIGPTQGRSGGQGGNGPGSSPVVDGDKVYVYGSHLMLMCLNTADGGVVWSHDIQSKFNGQKQSSQAIQRWGNTTSPIVEGDLVLVQGGGEEQTFLAFNKTTGALVWKKGTETLTHATPVVATIHGVRQVIFFVQSGLVSLDPKTGNTLWKQAYKSATAIGISPVVFDDMIYVSIGYNVGGAAFQVSKNGDTFSSKELWHTPGQNLNQWSTPVAKDGFVYGIYGQRGATLQCVEMKTGAVKWTGPAVGQGELVLIDNKLIIQCADGKLILADPNPQAYKEIASAQPITGQAWGWPAFSNGIFLYRTNTQAAAVDLSAQ